MTRRTASSKQIIAIAALIESNHVKIDEKTIEYTNDMSDQKIADAVSCPKSAVYKIRRENFGDIKRSQPVNLTVEARLQKIEDYLKELGYKP